MDDFVPPERKKEKKKTCGCHCCYLFCRVVTKKELNPIRAWSVIIGLGVVFRTAKYSKKGSSNMYSLGALGIVLLVHLTVFFVWEVIAARVRTALSPR